MQRTIPAEIEKTRFDLVVIGAGINGVAIARDAARRGLRTLVLDKGDIGGGTTSTSTRLIHGGLRYLEHREFDLVRESLRERERLLRNAPHLVKSAPMLLPIYQGARRGPKLIRLGMLLYDLLSFDRSVPRHRMLGPREARERAPALSADGLRGAGLYFDAQATFAERLAVENALDAYAHGATVITYARVDRILIENGEAQGVQFRDLLSDAVIQAHARAVVNVAGPWVDQVLDSADEHLDDEKLIGGTKGSHFVVPPFPGAPVDAVYYEAASDGRAIFVIPWNGVYLIGTSDTRFDGDLDDVRIEDDELAYFLAETNNLLPGANLAPGDVLYAYSGVRPLPRTPSGATAAITRRHVIHNHAPSTRNLYSIVGGKLTTHRSLAEEAIDKICRNLGVSVHGNTAREPLPGAAGDLEATRSRLTTLPELSPQTIEHLVDVYGTRAEEVAALARQEPELSAPIDLATGAIGAEVVFAVRHETAVSLADILLRRTMVGLARHAGIGPDEAAAAVARTHLDWDEERATSEVRAYRTFMERFRPKSLETRRLAQLDGPSNP